MASAIASVLRELVLHRDVSKPPAGNHVARLTQTRVNRYGIFALPNASPIRHCVSEVTDVFVTEIHVALILTVRAAMIRGAADCLRTFAIRMGAG